MASDHPFQQLFETFGKLPDAHAENVNLEARTKLRDQLSAGLEKAGHCILLKAPRAGHGKTHLLTRLQHELGGSHEFIPLHAVGGSRIDGATVLDDTLRRLVRPLPAAAGLTVLDLVSRRLFSSSLQPLVRSGEVPCQDREGALNALRSRPIETFDFHHPSAVTAHWARENFELLGPRLALELSQRNGLSLREVSFWVDAMFRFAATPIDNPGRARALASTVFDDPSAEVAAHERLVALLGLLTSLMRVVLVADELEGFSSEETAALRFGSFLGSLRQAVERLEVIVSINQDVWESAFLPRLSAGLADRLSEVVIELKPLDREAKIAILDSRAPGSGEKILDEMDSKSIPSHARGLISQAAQTWGKSPDEEPATDGSSVAAATPVAPPKEEEKQEPASPPAQEETPPSETVSSGTEMPDFSASTPEEPESPKPEAKAEAVPPEIPVQTPEPADFSSPPSSPSQPSQPDPEAKPPSIFASPSKQPENAPPAPQMESEPPAQEPPVQPSSWPSPEVSESDLDNTGKNESSSDPLPPPPQQPAPPEPVNTPQLAPPPVSEEAVAAFQGIPPIEAPPATFGPPPTPQSPPEQPAAPDPAPSSAPDDPTGAFQAAPEEKPAEDNSSAATTDRVDDLLKQFRERYGKG